jgi:uncharacterized protein YjbI with pentapeptide repeats
MFIDAYEAILTPTEKSELREEVFRDRALVGMDFTGADLSGARFVRMLIVRCSFRGADLRGAHFVMCDLREVDVHEAKLGDNRFYGTTMRGVTGLSDEDKREVVAKGAVIQHAHASLR